MAKKYFRVTLLAAALCAIALICASCSGGTGSGHTHTPNSDDGDCTTAITCSACGEITTAAKTHVATAEWSFNETQHWKQCTNDGCAKFAIAKANHSYANESNDCECGHVKTVLPEAEFKEFSNIVISIAENSIAKLEAIVPNTTAKLASSKTVPGAASTKESKNKIFDILNQQGSDTTVKNIKSDFYDVYGQVAFVPVICGEVITTKYQAPKFYGVPMLLSDWNQYIITESKGTLKRSYVYMPAVSSWTGKDLYIVMDFDYRSETDFSFSAYQFDVDYSSLMYASGNSSMDFMLARRDDSEGSVSGMACCYNNGIAKNIVTNDNEPENIDTVNACLSVVDHEFKQFDMNAIRQKFENVPYKITGDEFARYGEKYQEYMYPVEVPAEDKAETQNNIGTSIAMGKKVWKDYLL